MQGEVFCWGAGRGERPGAFGGVDGVREGALLGEVGGLVGGGWFEGVGRGEGTSMMGSWPFIPTVRWSFVMVTMRSRLRRLAGIGTVMSRSWMVCVHL